MRLSSTDGRRRIDVALLRRHLVRLSVSMLSRKLSAHFKITLVNSFDANALVMFDVRKSSENIIVH